MHCNFIFHFSIDATPEETKGYGRLANHSVKDGRTAHREKIEVDGLPAIYFVALVDLKPGEFVRYDYGDKASSRKDHPWLSFDMSMYFTAVFVLIHIPYSLYCKPL